MRGYRWASSSVHPQWVVALRPSSRPAAAKTKVPRHNPTISAPRRCALTSAFKSGGGGASFGLRHEGTIMIPALDRAERVCGVEMLNPAEVFSGLGSAAQSKNIEMWNGRLLPVLAEDTTRDGEVERAYPVESNNGDSLISHGGSF